MFEFNIGEYVIVTRRADIQKKKDVFLKTSIKGGYSDEVFVIVSGALVTSTTPYKNRHLIQTYRIANVKSPKKIVPARFYKNELRRASFYHRSQIGHGDSSSEDEAEN